MFDEITDGRTGLVFDYVAAGHVATSADQGGVTLLRWCSYYGDVSAIKFLLANGESRQSLGEHYGLNAAAFHGHSRLCQFLIEQGADVNKPLSFRLAARIKGVRLNIRLRQGYGRTGLFEFHRVSQRPVLNLDSPSSVTAEHATHRVPLQRNQDAASSPGAWTAVSCLLRMGSCSVKLPPVTDPRYHQQRRSEQL